MKKAISSSKLHDESTYHYDEDSDVMYISFCKPTRALSEEVLPGMFVRRSIKDQNKVVGMTIIGFKEKRSLKFGKVIYRKKGIADGP